MKRVSRIQKLILFFTVVQKLLKPHQWAARSFVSFISSWITRSFKITWGQKPSFHVLRFWPKCSGFRPISLLWELLAGTGVVRWVNSETAQTLLQQTNPSLKDEIWTEGFSGWKTLTYDWLARDRQTVRPITCQLLSDSAGPFPNGFHGRASGWQTPCCCLKPSQNTECWLIHR